MVKREMEDEERAMMMNRVREKGKEAVGFAQKQLSPIHHHIHFTLQAYFKCAYECYEHNNKNTKNNKEWVDSCVEYCSVPVLKAHYLAEHEVALFQSIKELQDGQSKISDSLVIAENQANAKRDERHRGGSHPPQGQRREHRDVGQRGRA